MLSITSMIREIRRLSRYRPILIQASSTNAISSVTSKGTKRVTLLLWINMEKVEPIRIRILSSKITLARKRTNVVISLTPRLVTSSTTTTVRLCLKRKTWMNVVRFLHHSM